MTLHQQTNLTTGKWTQIIAGMVNNSLTVEQFKEVTIHVSSAEERMQLLLEILIAFTDNNTNNTNVDIMDCTNTTEQQLSLGACSKHETNLLSYASDRSSTSEGGLKTPSAKRKSRNNVVTFNFGKFNIETLDSMKDRCKIVKRNIGRPRKKPKKK